MKEKLEKIKAEALARIESADALEKLNDIRVAYLGKKGELTSVLKSMKDVAAEDRPNQDGALSPTLALPCGHKQADPGGVLLRIPQDQVQQSGQLLIPPEAQKVLVLHGPARRQRGHVGQEVLCRGTRRAVLIEEWISFTQRQRRRDVRLRQNTGLIARRQGSGPEKKRLILHLLIPSALQSQLRHDGLLPGAHLGLLGPLVQMVVAQEMED